MEDELELYTGTLLYKGINFTFAFDKPELRLIPSEEDRHIIEWDWKMKAIGQGAYTFADPIRIDEPYIIGECNETNRKIVFIPKQGSTLGLYNSVVRILPVAYIICSSDSDAITGMSFSCPELNYIHPVNQALMLDIPADRLGNNGVFTVSTRDFSLTTTEKQTFIVDGNEIRANFGITRTVSTKIHEEPLRLDSSLRFEFDPLNDYEFIYRLWWIARDFVRFLCYRKNVFITTAKLLAPSEGGGQRQFATMYLLEQDGATELEALKKGRYIKQIHIAGHEGEILSDIADDNLYLRHLPDTYQAGLHMNAARFVMITAAFEWEFHRLFPDGVEKSVATIEAEEAVSECIQGHIDESSGKQKKIYKFLKRLVKSDSLQSEIVQTGKDLSAVVGMFGEKLYHINGETLDYKEMGQRLADQRNHFAHGDLDKDFIGLSLLDLIYLENIIYALQLKHYGIDDLRIQKSINELFRHNFAL